MWYVRLTSLLTHSFRGIRRDLSNFWEQPAIAEPQRFSSILDPKVPFQIRPLIMPDRDHHDISKETFKIRFLLDLKDLAFPSIMFTFSNSSLHILYTYKENFLLFSFSHLSRVEILKLLLESNWHDIPTMQEFAQPETLRWVISVWLWSDKTKVGGGCKQKLLSSFWFYKKVLSFNSCPGLKYHLVSIE